MKTTYDAGKAIRTRKENALEHFGLTRQNIINQISSTVLKNIRIYKGAHNPQNEEEFVAMMRKLGGYSEMIGDVIGPRPSDLDQENPAYWLWIIKNELKDAIREKVQTHLSMEAI